MNGEWCRPAAEGEEMTAKSSEDYARHKRPLK